MSTFKIYVAEPDVIDLAVVGDVLGDSIASLIAGNSEISEGDYASCDTILVRSGTRVNAETKVKMPLLQQVVRVGTGLDTIDLDFCEQAGIAVYNTPGANAEAVAEYALAVIMMALRKLHLIEPADLTSWNRFKFVGENLSSRRVGIVGFGNIGRLLYQKLQALGCKDFLLYDPFVTEAPTSAQLVPLEELLENSDIISLHLPLLPQTKHIIGAENLARLKSNAILLNTSRGGIVDEAAVLTAMEQKDFTYIADTVEGEPQVNPALIEQPNVIVTPHIGSLTHDSDLAMVRVAVENLLAGKTIAKLPS